MWPELCLSTHHALLSAGTHDRCSWECGRAPHRTINWNVKNHECVVDPFSGLYAVIVTRAWDWHFRHTHISWIDTMTHSRAVHQMLTLPEHWQTGSLRCSDAAHHSLCWKYHYSPVHSIKEGAEGCVYQPERSISCHAMASCRHSDFCFSAYSSSFQQRMNVLSLQHCSLRMWNVW